MTMPEGPGDLVGLYTSTATWQIATLVSTASTTTAMVRLTVRDPACAPCFVGQGVGCGGGDRVSMCSKKADAPLPIKVAKKGCIESLRIDYDGNVHYDRSSTRERDSAA